MAFYSNHGHGAINKWVNFNQSSIRDHWGISSVSDNGTGSFFVNFSGHMSNTNYAVTSGISTEDGFNVACGLQLGFNRSGTKTVSGLSVFTMHDGNTSVDPHLIMLMIIGD